MKKDGRFLKGFAAGALAATALSAAAFLILAASGLVSGISPNSGKNVLDGNFVKETKNIQKYINRYYLDSGSIDKKAVQDGMHEAMLASIGDEYAEYYTESEYEELMEDNAGEYCGIGAYVSQNAENGGILVVRPFEGGPADKAGIRAGDMIVEVDGRPVADMKLEEVVAMMKGKEGTTVVVKISRGSEEAEIKVERGRVDVPTVSHRMIPGTDIGYIYVASFDKITTSQFEEALDDIEAKEADSLIIDLRDNGGGLLDTAIDMLDMLLPEGLVMYTETRTGDGKKYYSTDEESYDRPMAVLINEYSASASEVFAGAMQDFGAASIIGKQSFGKGVVQSVFPLGSGGKGPAVKFTSSKYYTPKGRNIDGIGISPDIEAEYGAGGAVSDDFTSDGQLRAAVSFLSGER